MKVLFATTNPAKISSFKEKLEQNNIDLLTIQDIDKTIDVEETGKTAIENAYIKAKSYGDATGMITIGMDNNLFIENIPEEKQPGTHVRRVNGKTLTDQEMLDHYTNLVKEYGGNLMGKWVYGIVVYHNNNSKEYTWSKDKFCLVDKPCEKLNPGYPLDSITIIPKFNKYLSELTKEENEQRKVSTGDNNVINFICDAVKHLEQL